MLVNNNFQPIILHVFQFRVEGGGTADGHRLQQRDGRLLHAWNRQLLRRAGVRGQLHPALEAPSVVHVPYGGGRSIFRGCAARCWCFRGYTNYNRGGFSELTF